MPRCLLAITLMLLLTTTRALGRTALSDSTDVKIPTTRNEVENSIAVSPLNSKVLLVSNNVYSQATGNGGTTSWISLDAGKTWLTSDSLVLSPSRADPACVIGRSGGTNGRFFVNHLNSLDYELGVHYKNTTGGTSWTHVEIDPGKSENAGTDKNHLVINNNTSGDFQNYLISGYSEALTTSSLYGYLSTTNGATWSTSRFLIASNSGVDERDFRGINLQWSPPTPNRVYACWTSRSGESPPVNIGFRYSSDGGANWNSPSGGQIIRNIAGVNALSGKSMPLNLQAPSMAVDMDNGDIYIVFTEKPAGGSTSDVFVIKSTDDGDTWGSPVRAHASSTTKDQWQPWISWDDCTGAVVVTFLDSRGFTGNDGADTYMSVSYDGAATWTDFRVSDSGWDGDGFSGHYMGLAAKDGIAFPVWSDDRETGGIFKPYISPVYLWGVTQSSVSHSVVNDAGLELTVDATWTTNLAATGTDYLVLTSPSNVTYTATATGTGTSHSASKLCTCETGDWKYIVKSTRPGFTPRGSDQKTIRINACVD